MVVVVIMIDWLQKYILDYRDLGSIGFAVTLNGALARKSKE